MSSTAGVAIVGAAETEEIGTVALSALGLATDAARRALRECGLTPADVDGVASSGLSPYLPTFVAHSLGIDARWVDATMVGGCSNLVHLRHAVAAIEAGQCDVVLIAHGESGRSGLGGPLVLPGPGAWQGQFELPYGTVGPMTLLTLGALRFLRDRGLGRDALANVVVAQREWATRNPRALRRDPITVDEVLDAPVVAYPFTRPMCCVTTDAGGAIVVTSAERARDLPRPAVHVLGSGEATGAAMASQMPDLTSSDAFRHAGAAAFADAGVAPSAIQHAMLYDATAHLPLMALEDVGLVPRGEAGAFVADGNTAIGGALPVNTSGGGLNYTHSGMYGMYALQESVRQMRGAAPAQIEGAKISVCHGVGGMFAASGTIIFSNQKP